MGGKVSIILVMSFSILFALFGRNILRNSVSITENFSDYYSKTRAQSIAISGANMAINKLYLDKNWMAGFSNVSFSQGTFHVDIDTFGWDNRKITSIGVYNSDTGRVEIVLEPENFALFGNFYNRNLLDGVWWATGDTLSGRFHSNDKVGSWGDPVFLGPATSSVGFINKDKYSNPEFFGGTKIVEPIPLNFDTSVIRLAALSNGKIFRDTTNSGKLTTVNLTFLADGKVKYKQKIGSGSYTTEKTVPLNTLAPNGVIYVEKGNLRVEGTLNGRATIVASQKGDSNAGQIFITNSIQYEKDPLTNPACDDMLGMVAENKVTVTKDLTRGDITIHSSIFSQKDGLVIEKYGDYPTAHKMYLVGGIIGYKLQPTAHYVFNGINWVPQNGYSYIHKYDTRFLKVRPPYFPSTKFFRVVTWYEE